MTSRKDVSQTGASGDEISKFQTLRFRRTFERDISRDGERLARRLVGVLLFLKSDHLAPNPQPPPRPKTRREIALQLRYPLLPVGGANVFALRLNNNEYQLLLMF